MPIPYFPYAHTFIVLTLLFVLTSCSKPVSEQPAATSTEATTAEDDYDPHDAPISEEQKTALRERAAVFADAVAVIEELRNDVEQETAAGIPDDPYKAHQALDKVDLVLQWLPEIARDSHIPKEHWEAINTTANDLRTLFEQVHQNIDSKQHPDFAAISGQVDEKIGELEAIASSAGPDTSAEP